MEIEIKRIVEENLCKILGIRKAESKILVCLHINGVLIATDISKKIKMPLPTIYSSCIFLKNKGFF